MEKNGGVFLYTEDKFFTDFMCLLHFAVNFFPVLTYDAAGHGEVLLFGTCRCTFILFLQVCTDTVAELNYFA